MRGGEPQGTPSRDTCSQLPFCLLLGFINVLLGYINVLLGYINVLLGFINGPHMSPAVKLSFQVPFCHPKSPLYPLLSQVPSVIMSIHGHSERT